MTDELAFYAAHSAITDPGEHAYMLDGEPDDDAALTRWVRNVQFHESYAREAGVVAPDGGDPATADAAVRFVAPMLARVSRRDDRPLDAERAKDKCFIGTCRDYAVLLTALLRHRGRPARVRCGFALYFEPDAGFGDDHWLTEAWDAGAGRWRRIDAEVDTNLPQHDKVAIDSLDVPRHSFHVAGTAWRLCRRGDADPQRYGVAGIAARGEWFMAASVIRDLAALNKREMLPFDYWGLGTDICLSMRLTDAQRALIDELAALTADDGFAFPALREAYEARDGVRVRDPVKSWPKGVETDFRLGLA